MSLFARGHSPTFATEAQEVFDVTGAGDTVIALAAAAAGSSLEDSALFANVAAGLVAA